MEMSFEHILDFGIILFCFLQVGRYFPQGVYNRCFSITFNVVRTLCKTTGVNLFDFHDAFFNLCYPTNVQ